jgi:hypothetical protein
VGPDDDVTPLKGKVYVGPTGSTDSDEWHEIGWVDEAWVMPELDEPMVKFEDTFKTVAQWQTYWHVAPQKHMLGIDDANEAYAKIHAAAHQWSKAVIDAQEAALKGALGINDASEWPKKPPHKGAKWVTPESVLKGLDNPRGFVRLLERAGWTVFVLVPETEQMFTYGSKVPIKTINLGQEVPAAQWLHENAPSPMHFGAEAFTVESVQPKPNPAAERAKKLRKLIPDINANVAYPCSCFGSGFGFESMLWLVIQHLNDGHNPTGLPEDPWSRERIADWLESLDLNLNITPNKES